MRGAQEQNAKRHKALQEDQSAAADALLFLSNPAVLKQINRLECKESSLSDNDDDYSDTHSDCPSVERTQAEKGVPCQLLGCRYQASALEVKNHMLYDHVQTTIKDMVQTGKSFPIECPFGMPGTQGQCSFPIKTKAGFRSHVIGKHLPPEHFCDTRVCGTCGGVLSFLGRQHSCIKKNKESK